MKTKSNAVKADKLQIKVADLKPKKDAKGGATNLNASRSNIY